MNNEYRIVNVPRATYPMPPDMRSNVTKPCEHKYIYLGQRRVKDDYSKDTGMTKMVDVFYCEKCLKYQYKDC